MAQPAPVARQVKACAFCGEEVLLAALKCKHCGEVLDPAMRAAEEAKRMAVMASMQHAPAAAPQPVYVNVNQTVVNNNRIGGQTKKKMGISFVAAFLSLLIPGLGQLYRGRPFAGILWLFLTGLGYAAFVIPGLVLHFACILSAFFG